MYNKSDRHRSGNSVRDIVEGLNRKQREGKGRGRRQTGDRINARQAGSKPLTGWSTHICGTHYQPLVLIMILCPS